MTIRRIPRKKAALGALVAAGVVASCSGKALPPPGELMIAVTTDMAPGKDFDSLYVDVLSNGTYRYQGFNAFPTTVGAGAENQKMPATIALVAGQDPSTPALVRVIASKGGVPRVLREATVTVPTDRIAMLKMPIEWLNTSCSTALTQTAASDPAAAPDLHQCPTGQTCVAGTCQAATFTDKKLFPQSFPAFDKKVVFGGGSDDGTGTCFDTLVCFASPKVAQVDPGTCSIPNPGGTPNVALLLGTPGAGSDGICGPSPTSSCYVPLDGPPKSANHFGAEALLIGNKPSNWTTDGQRIDLPQAICDRLTLPDGAKGKIAAVVTTTACATKDTSTPTCGPWSAVGGGGGSSLGSGARDASVGQTGPLVLVSEPGKNYLAGLLGYQMVTAGGHVFWWSIASADAGNQQSLSLESASTASPGSATVLGTYTIADTELVVGTFTDGTYVYWVETTNGDGGFGNVGVVVHRVLATGGTPTVLSQVGEHQVHEEMGFDGTHLYFLDSDSQDATERLRQLDLLGNPPTTVASWPSKPFTNFGFIPLLQAASGPNGLVYGFGSSNAADWDLVSIPKTGSIVGPTIIAPSLPSPTYVLSTDGTKLYYSPGVSRDSGVDAGTKGAELFRLDIATGQKTRIVTNQVEFDLVAADATGVYWVGNGGDLYRADANGTNMTALYTPLTTKDIATAAALDSSFAYVTTASGEVLKIAAPRSLGSSSGSFGGAPNIGGNSGFDTAGGGAGGLPGFAGGPAAGGFGGGLGAGGAPGFSGAPNGSGGGVVPVDKCVASTANAASTFGCNGRAPGAQTFDNAYGLCAHADAGGCPTDFVCVASGGSQGLCLATCSPASTYVSKGGCPTGNRCFTVGSTASCRPDCRSGTDCSSGTCTSDGVCAFPP